MERFNQNQESQNSFEVTKEGARTMNDSSRIVLNVESALFASRVHMVWIQRRVSGPLPMGIGKLNEEIRIERSILVSSAVKLDVDSGSAEIVEY